MVYCKKLNVYVDDDAAEDCEDFKERTKKQEKIEEPVKVKEDGTKTTLTEAKKAEKEKKKEKKD
jgi:hypothetical protein